MTDKSHTHYVTREPTVVKTAAEKVRDGESQLLVLLGQLCNALQEEKVRNHNHSHFIHRNRTVLNMSVECFEGFGTEAFY